jgi:hypothetical protein
VVRVSVLESPARQKIPTVNLTIYLASQY